MPGDFALPFLGHPATEALIMALAAFGAATLLPFQSELIFVPLQLEGSLPLPVLIAVASLFNTAGSGVNYLLGRWIEHYRHRRWFPISEAQMTRARDWYARWGVWSLLLAFAPLGDAITVVAGVMRTQPLLFAILVAISKTGRYIALAWVTARVAGG